MMHYPVHRPVARTVLSGVVDAIVITAVLWRASRAMKLALGKDGLTNLIVGLVWRRAQPERFALENLPFSQATATL
jgi:hypothetical protein